jgi:hypothetical protein
MSDRTEFAGTVTPWACVRSPTVPASPATLMFAALMGVLVVVGRTETLTTHVLAPGVGPQILTAESPHVTSLRRDGWLANAVCWCGAHEDLSTNRRTVVSARGRSVARSPSVPRPATWPGTGGPERRGPAPEIRPRSQIAAMFLETGLVKSTGAGSVHVGTAPLQPDGWDVRWGLMEMAAAQRRDWTRRCPCRVVPMA